MYVFCLVGPKDPRIYKLYAVIRNTFACIYVMHCVRPFIAFALA